MALHEALVAFDLEHCVAFRCGRVTSQVAREVLRKLRKIEDPEVPESAAVERYVATNVGKVQTCATKLSTTNVLRIQARRQDPAALAMGHAS